MKRSTPFFVALGAGMLGLVLRFFLYRSGTDILSAGQPLHIACLVLSALVTVFLLVFLSRETIAEVPVPYPTHQLWAFGAGFLGGCFLIVHCLSLIGPVRGLMNTARLVLALAGGLAAMAGTSPLAATRYSKLGCHLVLCAHFALEMLCRYQGWSGDPQLPDYFFHVLACAALTLAAYQRMAFDARLGHRGKLRFFCLLGLYFCLLSTVGSDSWTFYLGGGLWAISALDAQTPPEEMCDAPA